MKYMKGDKALKSEWSKLRRQIVPKIGQLTNDAQAIHKIVNPPLFHKDKSLNHFLDSTNH